EKEDTRCDIYAFGALLYEMLTGKPPYQGQTTRDIRDRILAGSPKSIADVNPGANPGLVALAQGAMAREQRDRYANMSDVVADLARLKAGRQPAGPQKKLGFSREGAFWLRQIPKGVKLSTCLGGIVLLSWLLWPHERLRVTWNFGNPLIHQWDTAVLGDWSGAKRAALYVAGDTNFLVCDHEGDVLAQVLGDMPGVKNLRVDMASDLKETGKDAAFLSWSDGTNLNVVVLDRPSPRELRPSIERPRSREAPISPKVILLSSYKSKLFSGIGYAPNAKSLGTGSELRAVKVLPLEDNPTRHLLLTRILTGYGKMPRGLSCFDFESSKWLWSCLTAPFPNEVELVDVKGDRQNCFVFGSGAPCNGNKMEDGTDDKHAYIFAVSEKGTNLWKWQRQSSPGFAKVHPLVADLNQDGREEILAWGDPAELIHTNHNWDVGKVVQLDGGGRQVREYQAGACVLSCLAVDLDGDGKQEIVCTDCLGRVHLLNSDLSSAGVVPLVPRKCDHVELHVVAAITFGSRHKPRLIFRSSQHDQPTHDNPAGSSSLPIDKFRRSECTIFVTDFGFRRKASYSLPQEFTETTPFGWEVKVADMDGDGQDEIVSLSDHVEILKLKR
ncbi:MAG: hypothetical protein NT154_01870, partial [Verrucomicrobia bacterium]|nr:hypothetical protein [Verrucomicrobiota bacterium]